MTHYEEQEKALAGLVIYPAIATIFAASSVACFYSFLTASVYQEGAGICIFSGLLFGALAAASVGAAVHCLRA